MEKLWKLMMFNKPNNLLLSVLFLSHDRLQDKPEHINIPHTDTVTLTQSLCYQHAQSESGLKLNPRPIYLIHGALHTQRHQGYQSSHHTEGGWMSLMLYRWTPELCLCR